MSPTTFGVLSLSFSDGVPTYYPANTTKPSTANPDGTWDYFRPIAEGEAKDLLWRTKTATALVEKYASKNASDVRNYMFKKLPEGYKLFEHIKGKKVLCLIPPWAWHDC